MACESLTTLQAFKQEFLTRFEGTDEGEGKLLNHFPPSCVRAQDTTTVLCVGQAASEDIAGGRSPTLKRLTPRRLLTQCCTGAIAASQATSPFSSP
eukprot:1221809-Rhodomonas_salina.1